MPNDAFGPPQSGRLPRRRSGADERASWHPRSLTSGLNEAAKAESSRQLDADRPNFRSRETGQSSHTPVLQAAAEAEDPRSPDGSRRPEAHWRPHLNDSPAVVADEHTHLIALIMKTPNHIYATGFAFYDALHFSNTGRKGANDHGTATIGTLWELHPVWSVGFDRDNAALIVSRNRLCSSVNAPTSDGPVGRCPCAPAKLYVPLEKRPLSPPLRW